MGHGKWKIINSPYFSLIFNGSNFCRQWQYIRRHDAHLYACFGLLQHSYCENVCVCVYNNLQSTMFTHKIKICFFFCCWYIWQREKCCPEGKLFTERKYANDTWFALASLRWMYMRTHYGVCLLYIYSQETIVHKFFGNASRHGVSWIIIFG